MLAAIAPTAVEYLPDGQLLHTDDATTVEYDPAAHYWQEDYPVSD